MPSTESARLAALRRSHQYVKIEEEEIGSVALTLADALALLDAPQDAVLYLASWHEEVALATSAKTLRFDVVTYVPLFQLLCICSNNNLNPRGLICTNFCFVV